MKNLMFNSFTAIMFLLNFQAITSYSQSMIEIKLNSANTMHSNLIDQTIAVSFKVDTIQYKSAGGLEYSIKLINTLSKDITVKNPLDYLQIMLINEAGYNVRVPQSQRPKIYSLDKISPYQTFSIRKVMLNKNVMNIDSLSKEEIVIPSNSDYEITLRIVDILATQNGKPLINSNKIKLIPGKYKFGITLSLIGQGIVSQIFQLSPISINYN